jgi:hypothetical protein
MSELVIGAELVGTRVKNAARPEWGVGTVLCVQQTRVEGRPAYRVSIQFAAGHRTLLVPPARLVAPQPEPERQAGWLDGLGKSTLDDKLRSLPAGVVEVLGTPLQRLMAIVPLFEVSEDEASLLRWARSQVGVADPLSHWTRDELLEALRRFREERDAHFRSVAALLKQAEGAQALDDALATLDEPLRQAALTALRRPI